MQEFSSSVFEIMGNVGSYAPDGYSLASAIYINGKRHGKFLKYNEDGTLRYEQLYENDILVRGL